MGVSLYTALTMAKRYRFNHAGINWPGPSAILVNLDSTKYDIERTYDAAVHLEHFIRITGNW